MAFSFYIQGGKLSFAVYQIVVQGKNSGYFKHFVRLKKTFSLLSNRSVNRSILGRVKRSGTHKSYQSTFLDSSLIATAARQSKSNSFVRRRFVFIDRFLFQLRIFEEYQQGFDWKLMETKKKDTSNLTTSF